MPLNPIHLADMFRSGDLIEPIRTAHVVQHWVPMVVASDPVRAVQVYRALLQRGGTNYAAEKFLLLLESFKEHPHAYRRGLDRLRKVRPLPA